MHRTLNRALHLSIRGARRAIRCAALSFGHCSVPAEGQTTHVFVVEAGPAIPAGSLRETNERGVQVRGVVERWGSASRLGLRVDASIAALSRTTLPLTAASSLLTSRRIIGGSKASVILASRALPANAVLLHVGAGLDATRRTPPEVCEASGTCVRDEVLAGTDLNPVAAIGLAYRFNLGRLESRVGAEAWQHFVWLCECSQAPAGLSFTVGIGTRRRRAASNNVTDKISATNPARSKHYMRMPLVVRVERGRALGEALGLKGTPTVLVNGWRLPEPPDSVTLFAMAERILEGREPITSSRQQ